MGWVCKPLCYLNPYILLCLCTLVVASGCSGGATIQAGLNCTAVHQLLVSEVTVSQLQDATGQQLPWHQGWYKKSTQCLLHVARALCQAVHQSTSVLRLSDKLV